MTEQSLSVWHPQRSLGRLIRLPLRLLPKSKVMRIRRGPAKGMKWVVGSGIHGCWLGTYELDKQHVMEKYVKPGMAIYDIGANTGFYTLFFAQLAGPKGHVISFEPFPQNAACLINHAALNCLTNVQVVQAAVGNEDGLAGFSTGHGSYQNALVASDSTMLVVPVITLDRFIAHEGKPIPQLIKIDVEGAEADVLLGAKHLLEEHRPVLFVALHGDEPARRCREILAACGYTLHDLDGAKIEGELHTDEILALPRKS